MSFDYVLSYNWDLFLAGVLNPGFCRNIERNHIDSIAVSRLIWKLLSTIYSAEKSNTWIPASDWLISAAGPYSGFSLQVEALVLEMQDPKSGVKSQTQRLVITAIPHAITGELLTACIPYVHTVTLLKKSKGKMM